MNHQKKFHLTETHILFSRTLLGFLAFSTFFCPVADTKAQDLESGEIPTAQDLASPAPAIKVKSTESATESNTESSTESNTELKNGDSSAQAVPATDSDKDVLEMNPQDFFNLDLTVFSPAKKLQKLKNIPAAIYVITSEDIRRSGATNVVDVFRLVPGIEVAQVSSHEFAITSRGFNQVFGNKILLLIDGTPVESPIFNGILWENFNMPLDTIERIEFVRGPAAAIWGTRAMNGLINIITKDAYTLPHNTASLGFGNEHKLSAYARAGSVISENAAVQGYVKLDKYDGLKTLTGDDIHDDWDIFTAHFRGDFKPSSKDTLRVIGNTSFRQADLEIGVPTLTEPFSELTRGQRQNNRFSLSLLWERELENDSQLSAEWAQMYEYRKDFLLEASPYYSDFEIRHRLHPWKGHDFNYGLNVRLYTDSTTGTETLRFLPEKRSIEYFRFFLQDEIKIVDDLLTLTLGSRFEQNDQVGLNALPTARLLYSPSNNFSLWTGVTYTEGSPSRVYDNLNLNIQSFREPTSGLPALVRAVGNKDMKSEKLLAYEVGAWAEPIEKLYTSFTTYYFNYNNLVFNEIGEAVPILNNPDSGSYLLIPAQYKNGPEATSVGAEFTADWNISDNYSLVGAYSYININANHDAPNKNNIEDSPKHRFSIQNRFTYEQIEFDTILRYVNRIPKSEIGGYLEVDLHLGWQARQNLKFELIGRNIFDNNHREFPPVIFQTLPSQVQRSIFFQTTYTF